MRTVALLLLAGGVAAAQPKLTSKDIDDIRAAIREQAMNDNAKGTGRVWSERGPVAYRVQKMEPLTADVATVEVDAVRAGTYSEQRQYLFLMTHAAGGWTVARKVEVCSGPRPVRLQPLSGVP